MSESLYIDKRLGKEEIYLQILPQLKALVQDEEDWIANLANTCALLKEAFIVAEPVPFVTDQVTF